MKGSKPVDDLIGIIIEDVGEIVTPQGKGIGFSVINAMPHYEFMRESNSEFIYGYVET